MDKTDAITTILKKNRIYTEIATMLFISTLFGLPIDYSYMQKAPLNLQSDFDPNKYLTVWFDSRCPQSVENICVIIWLK